jgi:hypothetical protein
MRPRKEDAAPSVRQRRSCEPALPVHDPLLFVARVGVDVLPTNAPEIFPQTDWQFPYRDRFPTDTAITTPQIANLLAKGATLGLKGNSERLFWGGVHTSTCTQ